MKEILSKDTKEMLTYKTFVSLIGEGIITGLPTTLISFGKCNLRCNFCDSAENWNADLQMSIEELLPYIQKNIMFTGGEPLLNEFRQQFMYSTFKHFEQQSGLKGIYEIETNGTCYIIDYLIEVLSSINISPKESRYQLKGYTPSYKLLEQLNEFKDKYIIKFVFDNTEENKKFIFDIIERYKIDPERVYIMPEGDTPEDIKRYFEDALDFTLANNFRFIPRMHIMVYKPNYSKFGKFY
jgi:organic radical activating enzyme